MEATTNQLPQASQSAPPRRSFIAGDAFYTLGRAIVLVLLFSVAPLLVSDPASAVLWPPFASGQSVLIVVLWCYAAFALLAVISLFFPALAQVRAFSFLVDVGFLSLLSFFSGERRGIFYSLYLLPLVGAAIRLSPGLSLLFGLGTAIAYVAAFLGASYVNFTLETRDPLSLVELALRAATLMFIPWLTSGLSERWSENNRKRVELAQSQVEEALREAQAIRDQMRSLYQVALNLANTMNYQTVLHTTLGEARRLVPYTCGLVLLSGNQPDELYVAAAEPGEGAVPQATVTLTPGVILQALRNGAQSLTTDLPHAREAEALPVLRECQSAMLIPLRAGLHIYGLVIIGSNTPDSFTNGQLEMIAALANYAIVALHNAQLLHELREERAKLISKEEEVRRQLARDLHDGPAQAVAVITMNIEFIKRLLDRDPARVLDELEKLGQLAKRTTHDIRTMLFELRPLVLETQGLVATLEQYIERFKGSGPEIILDARGLDVRLDTRVEGTLFNIIQESVNNALKHAAAKHIWVRLRLQGPMLETTVQDDGRGFDLAKVRDSYERRGSFGLLNIDERARLVGGMAEVHSAPGQGTTVRLLVPVEA